MVVLNIILNNGNIIFYKISDDNEFIGLWTLLFAFEINVCSDFFIDLYLVSVFVHRRHKIDTIFRTYLRIFYETSSKFGQHLQLFEFQKSFGASQRIFHRNLFYVHGKSEDAEINFCSLTPVSHFDARHMQTCIYAECISRVAANVHSSGRSWANVTRSNVYRRVPFFRKRIRFIEMRYLESNRFECAFSNRFFQRNPFSQSRFHWFAIEM